MVFNTKEKIHEYSYKDIWTLIRFQCNYFEVSKCLDEIMESCVGYLRIYFRNLLCVVISFSTILN